MAYLEEQEWLALNEIGYNISFISDFDQMRKSFFEWLKLLMDFDCALFSLLHQEGTEITLYKTLVCNVPEPYVTIWEEEMQKSKSVKLLACGINSHTCIDSQMLSRQKMRETSLYDRFNRPLNLGHSMNTCYVFKNEPIGLLQLFRDSQSEDFSKREIFIMEQIYKHLAYRLNYESKKSSTRFFYGKGYVERIRRQYQFTDREMELFGYAVKGFTNIEIAEKVNISIHTVKKHFHNIYDKMGVSGRVELLNTLPRSYNKINFDEL